VQEEIYTRALAVKDELKDHPILSEFWDSLIIALSGSATTVFADQYSGIDLLVVYPASKEDFWLHQWESKTGDVPAIKETIRINGEKVKVWYLSDSTAKVLLMDYDDEAMFNFATSRILHDPENQWSDIMGFYLPYPPQVLTDKIREQYRLFRRNKAALIWNLRRGQPYAVLINLTELLENTLLLCFYLDSKVPVGRKWLFRGSFQTTTGKAMKAQLFELFSALGEIAVLGGTREIKHNQLYRRISEMQEVLVQGIKEQGEKNSSI